MKNLNHPHGIKLYDFLRIDECQNIGFLINRNGQMNLILAAVVMGALDDHSAYHCIVPATVNPYCL